MYAAGAGAPVSPDEPRRARPGRRPAPRPTRAGAGPPAVSVRPCRRRRSPRRGGPVRRARRRAPDRGRRSSPVRAPTTATRSAARRGDRAAGRPKGWSTDVSVHTVLGRWPTSSAPRSPHTAPGATPTACSTVQTDSTAWATQLRLLAPTVVARLNAELGDGTVPGSTSSGPTAPSWRTGPRAVRTAAARGTPTGEAAALAAPAADVQGRIDTPDRRRMGTCDGPAGRWMPCRAAEGRLLELCHGRRDTASGPSASWRLYDTAATLPILVQGSRHRRHDWMAHCRQGSEDKRCSPRLRPGCEAAAAAAARSGGSPSGVDEMTLP